MTDREAIVRDLHRHRPRNRLLRVSALLAALVVALAWFTGGFRVGDFLSADRTHLDRFMNELRPAPVRQAEDWGEAAPWAARLFIEEGSEAMARTFAIAVAAIVLAGAGALLLSAPAARTLATPEPYLPSPRAPGAWSRWLWRGCVALVRAMFIILRSLPEYVLAFLLVAMYRGQAWPAVLALALHNLGILGKLGAEVVENVDPAVPRSLRGLGATRMQIAVAALLPRVLPRFLLFFFYRWEMCIREAIVLGMLGIATLGRSIDDARVVFRYDQMMFFILLGAVLVLAGDVISMLCRGVIRRAS